MDAAPILSHFARIGFRISSRMAASALETLVAGKAGRIKFCANRDNLTGRGLSPSGDR
jgi:hypothetical protein